MLLTVDLHLLGVADDERISLFGVDGDVVDGHALGLTDDNALFGLADHDVLHADIVNRHLRQTVEEHGSTGSVADYVADVNVAEGRGLLCDGGYIGLHALCNLLFSLFTSSLAAVEEVEQEWLVRNINHVNAVDVDVFYHDTTTTGTLEAKTYIGTEEGAVGYVNILHTTRHLTTYYKTSMAMEYDVVSHNHVLAGLTTTATVSILARFDTDGIVTRIKDAAGNQSITARLQVECIAVLRIPGIEDLDIIKRDVVARQGMQTPTGRILERNTLKQHLLALDKAE